MMFSSKEAEKRYLRYQKAKDKALSGLSNDDYVSRVEAVKKCYGFCHVYHQNLKALLDKHCSSSFIEALNASSVLVPWKDTYYFNKEKCEMLLSALKGEE